MNNRTFKYIFGVMLTSVLLMAGCGSSSNNNPVSSGNVSSGLVNVSGRVTNLSGSGRVSFFTPTVAIKNGMNVNNTFRTSVSNEGVYSFNTDENGNYSGQIPEGDYYVIAENSNGTMKSVSSKQTFRASATPDSFKITLKATVDITGTLKVINGLSSDTVPVYIENSPFVAINTTKGFTFNGVPEGAYTIVANIDANNVRYKFSLKNLTVGLGMSSIVISDYETSTSSGKTFTGKVTDGTSFLSGKSVTAIFSTGEVYFAMTDSNGSFSMPFSSSDGVTWLVDMQIVTMDSYNTIKYIGSESESSESSEQSGIIIKEKTDGSIFAKTNETVFTLFDSNSNVLCSENFYFPATYTVNNLKSGNYSYMIECRNPVLNSYGYRFCDNISVKENSLVTTTANHSFAIVQPRISNFSIETNKYTMGATIEGSSYSNALYEPFAYAINNETDSFTSVLGEVTKPTVSIIRASTSLPFSAVIDLNVLPSGSYDIYAGFSIKYNGNCVATITTDPYPYVKH